LTSQKVTNLSREKNWVSQIFSKKQKICTKQSIPCNKVPTEVVGIQSHLAKVVVTNHYRNQSWMVLVGSNTSCTGKQKPSPYPTPVQQPQTFAQRNECTHTFP
jgi:hypothetical protein